MHPMTLSHLQSAFAGESQAHMRYLVYAEKAEKDEMPQIGRLFQAIAWAEQIHASSHFVVMRDQFGAVQTVAGAGFGLGTTAENLAVAIEGEDFEVAEMYPVYKAAAEFQEERGALRSFDWAWKAEQTHAALFREAKAAAEAGGDLEIDQVNVCSRCGHTLVGDAPDRCPICNAKKETYRAF
ncbi:MAG: rubrerythrin family protein [Anaerolineae bacterium]|jgi:rubrerythrin